MDTKKFSFTDVVYEVEEKFRFDNSNGQGKLYHYDNEAEAYYYCFTCYDEKVKTLDQAVNAYYVSLSENIAYDEEDI